MSMRRTIEVAIPCFNEAEAIGKVVQDFRRALPEAAVVVYDNGSSDTTADTALAAGADVRRVNRRGKGFVVQAIFERSRADIVLMVDGDDTYEAEDARLLLAPVLGGEADMTIGTRLERAESGSFRHLHRWGNRMLTRVLNLIFRTAYQDVLSGYRAFSRRFLDSVPLTMPGFETETELMLQALELGLVVRDIPIRYRERPAASASKLRTIRDGYRILVTILILLRDHRPLVAFGVASGVVGVIGLALWVSGLTVNPGLRAAGALLGQAALVLFLAGLMLNTINTRFRELQSLLRRSRGLSEAEEPSQELLLASGPATLRDIEAAGEASAEPPPNPGSFWERDR